MISSLTNVLLSILVARTVDAAAFGEFGLAFALYSFAVGMSRSLSSQPLGIRYATVGPDVGRTAAAASTGCALVVGAVVGAVCIGCGLMVGGTVGASLVVLGGILPGLLLQDAWRYVFFTAGRPAAAAANDAFWGISQIAMLLVVVERHGGVATLLGAWGLAAAAAAALGVWQAKVRPAPLAAARWLLEHRRLSPFLAAEYAVNMGAYNMALAALAGLGQLVTVGALRGAQVLLGPVRILMYAAQSVGLPELARRAARQPGGLTRDCALVSLVLGGAGACVTGIPCPDAAGLGRSPPRRHVARGRAGPAAGWRAAGGGRRARRRAPRTAGAGADEGHLHGERDSGAVHPVPRVGRWVDGRTGRGRYRFRAGALCCAGNLLVLPCRLSTRGDKERFASLGG